LYRIYPLSNYPLDRGTRPDTRRVLEWRQPSHPFPVYTEAYELAEPNRTLV